MLVVPLVLGTFAFFGVVQWYIQDARWEEEIEKANFLRNTVIQEVEPSQCVSPKPEGPNHICAQSLEWWSPTESTDCEGGQCYTPTWWNEYVSLIEELEKSYVPILLPGWLPLLFLFLVIRKIAKARKVLTVAEHHPQGD